jgi:hypothetical protein
MDEHTHTPDPRSIWSTIRGEVYAACKDCGAILEQQIEPGGADHCNRPTEYWLVVDTPTPTNP